VLFSLNFYFKRYLDILSSQLDK